MPAPPLTFAPSLLPDRGLIRLSGTDAASFLNGLVCQDVTSLAHGQAVFAALLSPQGKILYDFFILRQNESLWLDVAHTQVPALYQRLKMYQLRAKIQIEDMSMKAQVVVAPRPLDQRAEVHWYCDPRLPDIDGLADMGYRAVCEASAALEGILPQENSAYAAHHVRMGVPRGGVDFAYGDAFPHDVNMDKLHGISFTKGCYIGQEVVSRMQHRSSIRKRILPICYKSHICLPIETPIMAADQTVGVVKSGINGRSLALLRLDRVQEARAAGIELYAAQQSVRVCAPPWMDEAGFPECKDEAQQ